jgi:hypothetical protein
MIPQKYLANMEKYEKEPDYYGVVTIQLYRKGRKVKPRFVFHYEESNIDNETDDLSVPVTAAFPATIEDIGTTRKKVQVIKKT